MTSGRTASELAVLAVFCILTIFLFPVMQGPYSAVHGPVTALQSARAAYRLRISIVQSALKSSRNSPLQSLVLLAWVGAAALKFRPVGLAECDSILRC
ncbi:MAG: hypothetical protein WA172_06475 [Terriglobales bacterium]